MTRGSQGAAPLRGFHHQRPQREAGDYPVPTGEVVRKRTRPRGKLGQHRAGGAASPAQFAVLRGIQAVVRGAEDGDGSPASPERGPVGGRIHPAGKPADHSEPGFGQPGRESFRDSDPVGGSSPGAHNRYRRSGKVSLARCLEGDRGHSEFGEPRRIARLPQDQQASSGGRGRFAPTPGLFEPRARRIAEVAAEDRDRRFEIAALEAAGTLPRRGPLGQRDRQRGAFETGLRRSLVGRRGVVRHGFSSGSPCRPLGVRGGPRPLQRS